ncbi:MAG: NTP transferase domain-containing protein [Planctomycetota bacterium]|nr:NTP transferase domain-containing protein [Planctomycetota bacterium]MDA1212427.1 NTP transferase domain-containing protein [Planctomycetota bacterium]
MTAPIAIILAAGKSTRMKSELPKVLHPVGGRPMIEWVLDSVRDAGAEKICVVVGHKADLVRTALSQHADVEFAVQNEQKGTGHAVMMCEPVVGKHQGAVLVLAGDTPLLRAASLGELLKTQADQGAACVIGTAVTNANQGLGRIVRGAQGEFLRIVEQKDCTPEHAAITEINTGCFAFDGRLLFEALSLIQPNNVQREYYLTDAPAVLLEQRHRVMALPRFDINEALGVNTRVQLAEVETVLQQRIQQRWMTEGVSIVSPTQTYIDSRATIGVETVILPFTTILGAANIGNECRIGPHAVIEGPVSIENETSVSPFTHLSSK